SLDRYLQEDTSPPQTPVYPVPPFRGKMNSVKQPSPPPNKTSFGPASNGVTLGHTSIPEEKRPRLLLMGLRRSVSHSVPIGPSLMFLLSGPANPPSPPSSFTNCRQPTRSFLNPQPAFSKTQSTPLWTFKYGRLPAKSPISTLNSTSKPSFLRQVHWSGSLTRKTTISIRSTDSMKLSLQSALPIHR